MASTSLSGMQNLPSDVLLCIFSFLPIPDVARCAAVSKQWQEIVTGFTHLWKGKKYVSDRRPGESAEVRAVLRALPPLEELVVKVSDEFGVDVFYPCVGLYVTDTSDLSTVLDSQRLRCEYLIGGPSILEGILSSRSIVDLSALRKLRIAEEKLRFYDCARVSREQFVVTSALELCPNLGELRIYALSLSAKVLDASAEIGRLRTLEIQCPSLEDLSFLRHCSNSLEQLELVCCTDLPSSAFVALRHLGSLRRLQLYDCRVVDGDLEKAAEGLQSLESLELDACNRISDLSSLRHCGRLQDLRIDASWFGSLLSGHRHLPTSIRSLCLVASAASADELFAALPLLPQLEDLDLMSCDLAHLRFLCHCPQLRRLCLKYSNWSSTSELSNLCHVVALETLDLTSCRVDVDVLSGALSHLPRLDSLTLSCAKGISDLKFLRHCPQLRTLSLYNICGMELTAYRELSHASNLQELHVSPDVRDFVCEVVRPCLPKVMIK